MKFLYVSAALVCLTACAQPSDQTEYTQEQRNDVWELYTEVIVDPKTNCQYIVANEGITPRLNSDGTPMCSAPQNPQPVDLGIQ